MELNSISRDKNGERDDRGFQKMLRFNSACGKKEQLMMPSIIVIGAPRSAKLCCQELVLIILSDQSKVRCVPIVVASLFSQTKPVFLRGQEDLLVYGVI